MTLGAQRRRRIRRGRTPYDCGGILPPGTIPVRTTFTWMVPGTVYKLSTVTTNSANVMFLAGNR